ncbi:MAG: hypothetical protein A2857_04460 [Candidatus Levybacteria bacterium RIFCSPHIGHO2_01_FULL_36_15]|nr:MAG: hypothetical protein A2857_04460 [Candidatus Levybacteria bacterium RIFCSPHIGHO2_01_FULL_36_15]OGH38609.1 MAG: hypothetical protein A2905_03215 [Candidatus Levybacteria bacterium RIFCSPLOWO2_01_FULL_36_10]
MNKVPNRKGKFIVIEGGDGSGKATQLALLKDYLEKAKIPVQTIDFPRYYDSFYGKVVARFLKGEFGSIKEVNPYLVSIVYALDRADAKADMNKWLEDGNIILANRYVPSNLAHQSSKLPPKERDRFLQWDMELEYEVNKLPKEDIVIYLHVPHEISSKLVKNANRKGRQYLGSKGKDIHEKDKDHLKKTEKIYQYLSKKFPHWVVVGCVKNGLLRSREDIHKDILNVLKSKKIL